MIIVDFTSKKAIVKILLEVGQCSTINTDTLTGMPPELVYQTTAGM